jgi:formylglycine-generating enzyme required for sulfatase activity
MGSADSDPAHSHTTHQVTVKSFQMAKTLVTNKQYKACVDAGACTAATEQGPSFDGDDQPVVGVDRNQAEAFSGWVGGRLPSEAEWEYAARSAGKDWKYPWGNEDAACERAVISGCARATAPVCSKPAGNTEQGLCDMAGDAWEWMADWHRGPYDEAPNDGSAWENAGFVGVFRGGSWSNVAAYARSAGRDITDAHDRGNDLGFRPAR